MMVPAGGFVELSEGKVSYELAGPEDGETVVFVHGLIGNKTMWSPLFEDLAEQGFRVLRFDLYGRGLSDKPEIEYHLPLFIIQILELIDTLVIQTPIHLVGLSLGSLICAAFASELREFVKDVVLISPAGLGVGINKLLGIAKKEGLGEMAVKAISAKPIVDILVNWLAAESGQEEVSKAIEANLKDPGYHHAILSTLRNIELEDGGIHYSVLGKSRRPVMALWGEKDRLVPFDHADNLKALIPELQLKSYKGIGHMPNTEAVDEVLGDILAFWQTNRPQTKE